MEYARGGVAVVAPESLCDVVTGLDCQIDGIECADKRGFVRLR